MNHHRSIRRIVLASALVIAASASTTHCEAWDPFGIQDTHEYMPFGPYGPKLTIGTPSPTKIRNGGSFGQKNRTASHNNTVAQNRTVARRVAPSRTTRFDNLNLSVTMPTGPWVKLDPQQTGSKAHLVLRRTNPTIFISLAGQRADSNTIHTNSSLLSESQAKMQSFPGATIQPVERPLSANGIPGITYQATVPSGESNIYYALWVSAHHGYNYKLAVYGNQQDQPAIDEALQIVLSGLQPIQTNRVARSNGNRKAVTR